MSGEKILLVDTEVNVLLTYQSSLEEEGYQVDIARSLEEAFDKLAQETYSTVITELYLKSSTTLKLIRHIRQDKPEIYIIMVTATLLSPHIYKEVLDAGVQDCFTKPFPIHKILPHINKGLTRRKLILKMIELEQKNNFLEKSLTINDSFLCEKRHFMQIFRQEQRRSERYKRPFSFIVVTIKTIEPEMISVQSNVIEKISTVLLSTVRHTDYATRFNNSYSLILPETTQSGTQHLTKRLGEVIKDLSLTEDDVLYRKLTQETRFVAATYPDESEKILEWMKTLDTNH